MAHDVVRTALNILRSWHDQIGRWHDQIRPVLMVTSDAVNHGKAFWWVLIGKILKSLIAAQTSIVSNSFVDIVSEIIKRSK